MQMFSLIVFIIILVSIAAAGNDTLKTDKQHPATQSFFLQKDSSKNAALQLPNPVNIYLTIDDGPSEASFYLSNIAMADSVFINVFVVGDSVYKNDSRKIFFGLYQANPFIEIGNHSFSHANKHYHLYYENAVAVVQDFELNADTIRLQTKIVRLPGRNTWRINERKRTDLPDDSTSADLLATKGCRIFGWDIEWRCNNDSSHSIQTAESLMKRIENTISKKESFTPGHLVILCHESMFTDAANRLQLELLLKEIKRKSSYRLERLSKYP